jgi:hypothetical protein
VVGDPVAEEDRVVHLLASLPDSYNMWLLPCGSLKMEVVTDRLLHEEQKWKDWVGAGESCEKAMEAKQQGEIKGPKCHHCTHIRRNCRELAEKSDSSRPTKLV